MITHELFNSPVGYFFRSRIRSNEVPPYSVTSHFHSSFEFILVTEGSFSLIVNGKEERLEAGDSALILPYSVHSFLFDQKKPFRFWLVTFSKNYVNTFSRSMENHYGSGVVFRLSGAVKQYLESEILIDECTDLPLFVLKSGLYAIIAEYLKNVPLAKRQRSDSSSLILKITEYVREHYADKLSLERMAHDLGYSYSYLSHSFKSLFSLSFTSYVNLYRVDSAEADLLGTDLAIVEIAEKNGFSSIRNFNYVFRNFKGVSPREYRSMHGAIL